MEIVQFGKDDMGLLKRFARFPWELYKDDELWVPPLDMDLLGNRLLGSRGLLTSGHPYHRHAKSTYFLALEDEKVIGRIAASVNMSYNEYHSEKTGFFGFFEVIDDYSVARELLDSARTWLASRGMSVMRGPSNFSSNETWGLLVDNFSDFPFMETVYNKRYYADFLQRYGFTKAKDLIGQILPVSSPDQVPRHERLLNIARAISEKKKVTIRHLDLKRFDEEILLMNEIYNQAWEKNWGFVPMDREEFIHAAQNMKIIADPSIIIFAYVAGRPAAFIGTLPDVNCMIKRERSIFGNSDPVRISRILLKRRNVPRIRLMLFGIKNEYRRAGIDSLLYLESFAAARRRGYKECEISWLLEDNLLVIRAGISQGGRNYKTWRIFDLPLS